MHRCIKVYRNQQLTALHVKFITGTSHVLHSLLLSPLDTSDCECVAILGLTLRQPPILAGSVSAKALIHMVHRTS